MQTFKITHSGINGPWPNRAAYYNFSMTVLQPRFPRADSVLQKLWIIDTLAYEIDQNVTGHITVETPSCMNDNRFSFGLYVFDQEIATIIKLTYS